MTDAPTPAEALSIVSRALDKAPGDLGTTVEHVYALQTLRHAVDITECYRRYCRWIAGELARRTGEDGSVVIGADLARQWVLGLGDEGTMRTFVEWDVDIAGGGKTG